MGNDEAINLQMFIVRGVIRAQCEKYPSKREMGATAGVKNGVALPIFSPLPSPLASPLAVSSPPSIIPHSNSPTADAFPFLAIKSSKRVSQGSTIAFPARRPKVRRCPHLCASVTSCVRALRTFSLAMFSTVRLLSHSAKLLERVASVHGSV